MMGLKSASEYYCEWIAIITTMCPGVTMVLVGVLNMNMIDCGLGGVVPTNVANSGSK